MIALAVVAFVVGAVVGSHHGGSPQAKLVDQFVAAWSRGDYQTMYGDVDAAARRQTSEQQFAHLYEQALTTATAGRLRVAGPARAGAASALRVPVEVQTKLWGRLHLAFTFRTRSSEAEGTRILWTRALVFPGLRAGEQLSRHTYLPRRATLLARDGSVLAESSPASAGQPATTEETRNSPLGEAASAVLGTVGPIPASRLAVLEAEGVPANAEVGLSGVELALDAHLRGTPGGELLAGTRPLASVAAHAAPAVHTTVSPSLQQDAVTALGSHYGGIVAFKPSSGEILAVAGIGLDGLQPPGSTFKIVTLTGVLQAKLATPRTVFPYATYATLDGVKLNNANGEDCGGSLELSFAVSCNSVFTPLGVKLGAPRLVATAEHFGFNQEPSVAGAAESSLPPASDIQGELAVGSTAIGQGEVLATPLQMATVAGTIADDGHRPSPTFLPSHPHLGPTVMSPTVAHTVRHLMTEVVREGTGTSAAIPGVVVAGKTGTAELKTPCKPEGEARETEPAGEGEDESENENEEGHESCHEEEASNTDAWFAAFAPARNPRIVVCVMLVKDGAGGDTAAPLAKEVLESALRSGV
ncbi:MAG TPA: penicillin-binding transpeptidase domain-containing protein [Solirubrobacteraceae bacterium]